MNLSQEKRNRMLAFIDELKSKNATDEKAIIQLNEIANEINAKKYGLVWEEHEEQVDIQMKDNIPVFTEDIDRELKCNDDDDSYNFILEGDNLHSLYLLQKTHKGKIDVIYIDPPYNTGNNDFIYDDDYVDGLDGYKNSKWLSFMKKRLDCAHSLLSKQGLIFVSIDDNQQASLKMLLDEVFDARNFIGCFIVNAAPNGRDYGAMAKQHEYCLLYARDFNSMYFNKVKVKDKKFTYEDENGGFNIHPLYNSNVAFTPANRPNLYYPFYVNKTKNKDDDFYEISLEKKKGWAEVYPPMSVKGDAQFVWRWGRIKSAEFLNKEIIGYKVGDNFRIVQKMRHDEKIVRSLLLDTEFATRRGTAEVEEIFKDKRFGYPKPLQLIKLFMEVACSEEALVLDFFAGSGTTGHAVLELNNEDGGNRHFILCTNNENKICEKVTYVRNKTVITGKRQDRSKYSDGIPANLKYYRTDFVDKNSGNVVKDINKHIKELIQLEWGVSIDKKEHLMVLTETELDKIEEKWDKLQKTVKSIYRARNVIYTAKQKKLFKNINNYIIPDYYFDKELKEVGENW